jgi:hypothetical protein
MHAKKKGIQGASATRRRRRRLTLRKRLQRQKTAVPRTITGAIGEVTRGKLVGRNFHHLEEL